MYIPQQFRVEDRTELVQFLQNNSFGILFSQNENGPLASHLPFLFQTTEEGDFLVGHMAKANPHWQEIDGPVLVVFHGPHAYISPTYYQEPNTVPTWNYVAVHAYGTLEVIEDKAALVEILADSVQFYEAGSATPWPMPERVAIEGMLNAIVGFRIRVERLEGKWKLNQHHPIARQERVVAALERHEDQLEQGIAKLMKQNVAKKAGLAE